MTSTVWRCRNDDPHPLRLLSRFPSAPPRRLTQFHLLPDCCQVDPGPVRVSRSGPERGFFLLWSGGLDDRHLSHQDTIWPQIQRPVPGASFPAAFISAQAAALWFQPLHHRLRGRRAPRLRFPRERLCPCPGSCPCYSSLKSSAAEFISGRLSLCGTKVGFPEGRSTRPPSNSSNFFLPSRDVIAVIPLSFFS